VRRPNHHKKSAPPLWWSGGAKSNNQHRTRCHAGENFQAELGHYDWDTGVQSIVVGSSCIGAVLDRGGLGFEASDADEILLGTFADSDEAFKAVSDCWEIKLRSNGGSANDPSLQPGPAREGNGQLIGEVDAQPDPATPELTLFVNAHGALTKQFTLDADGNLVKTEGGQMTAGTAMRIVIDDVQALADLIGTMSSDQALVLGSMRGDLSVQVTVITKKALNGVTAPDIISRSREYLTFGEGRRGFCLGARGSRQRFRTSWNRAAASSLP
jgi:hypothetical protein